MQIRCEQCGAEGEAAGIRTVEGAVWVVCGGCGEASPLLRNEPAAAPTIAPEPVTATRYATTGVAAAVEAVAFVPLTPPHEEGLPPHKCPKCAHRQDDDHACHKCGLVFANAQKRRPWEEVPANRKVAYGRVETAFRALVAGPADAAAHETFEALATREQAVEHAIRLYRHHLSDHPSDEVSRAALAGLVHRAHLVAQSMARDQIRTSVGSAGRSLKWVLAGAVVLLLVAAAVFLVKLLRSQQQMLP